MPTTIIDPARPVLTHRERFRRQMHFQNIDRGVHWEFGYLQETLDRWHTEGLPAEITASEGPGSVEEYFGVESSRTLPVMIGLWPPFAGEPKVIEQRADSEVLEDPSGMVYEQKTEGVRTIPHYLKYPIANREDWARFKDRLDPNHPERHKVDW
ncbi:hypothetical protein HQ590_10260, partial [bacterium]|nr:hypothetical protein [bacterium]